MGEETALMTELKKWDAKYLAKETGAKRTAVWKWKKGERVPSEKYRESIARITGKTVGYLFYGEGVV